MNVQTFDDIYNDFKNYLIANQNKLTDFTDGSILNTIIEAYAMQLEKFYNDTRNGFANNLKNIIYSLFKFSQKKGTYANGYVVFYRANAIDTASTIPAGTKVSDGTKIYVTQANSSIAANQTQSPSVFIKAIETGKDYNIEAGSITAIETILSNDISGVTNPQPIAYGTDSESDMEMFNRFVLYINSLQGSSIYAVQSAVLEIDSISKVKVVEHFEDTRDTNFTVYAYNGTNTLTTEEINEITKLLNGDGTEDYPGIKPIGVNFDVQSVSTNPVNVEYRVTVSDTSKNVESEVRTQIENLFASLDIGDTLYISELISSIRKLSYIKDVTIITPSSNVTIQSNSINTLGIITKSEV